MVETAFLRGGLQAVETICRRHGIDLSLLACIAENVHGEWDRDLVAQRHKQ